MSTIIMRSALVAWGQKPPRNLHSIVSTYEGRRVITWNEVIEKRREDQARRLDQIRRCDEWRAWKIWVAYFDQNLMGGWHAFIERPGNHHRHWIDRDRPYLIKNLAALFPLVLGDIDHRTRAWEHWKMEFAKQHQRRKQCRQPLGVVNVWWDERGPIRLTHPQRTPDQAATA